MPGLASMLTLFNFHFDVGVVDDAAVDVPVSKITGTAKEVFRSVFFFFLLSLCTLFARSQYPAAHDPKTSDSLGGPRSSVAAFL